MSTVIAPPFCRQSGEPVHETDTDEQSHYRCDCGTDVPTTSMGDDPNVAGWRYLDLHQTPQQAAAAGGDQ